MHLINTPRTSKQLHSRRPAVTHHTQAAHKPRPDTFQDTSSRTRSTPLSALNLPDPNKNPKHADPGGKYNGSPGPDQAFHVE